MERLLLWAEGYTGGALRVVIPFPFSIEVFNVSPKEPLDKLTNSYNLGLLAQN